MRTFFHIKYESSLNRVHTSNEITSIPNLPWDRPLTIVKLDEKNKEHLHIYQKEVGVEQETMKSISSTQMKVPN